ncbi:MAG TPA: 5-oxoprolinase subunit PxpA [Clostridia bacterium]|nr:5-oxoprolinase subunit PxpA [Clostridia bacterium]HPQ45739.1 5-oxoprolinase subunit PxpA [Clostridia bacterium]HRX42805.1 5-oxoprolinase subunit PxpA [Clostridia bacterium]
MIKGNSIDINSDIGEGFPFDRELLSYISSANICCGAHAGSLDLMKKTIFMALEEGVAAGAHPGYPDRDSFGRCETGLDTCTITDNVVCQVAAFNEYIVRMGSSMSHLKLHGALYNRAASDYGLMHSIVKAVVSFTGRIPVYTLAGSESMEAIADAGGIPVGEAFADRGYNPDGTLMQRGIPGAVIEDVELVASRVLDFARGKAPGFMHVGADTICIHGDTSGALAMALRIRQKLNEEGISIVSKFSVQTSFPG